MNFSTRFKNELFNITNSNFNEKALELFNYQAENNKVYQSYLQHLKITPGTITDIIQIPFIPIQFFKRHQITTGDDTFETIFYSSGTTGEDRSCHYVKDLHFYRHVSRHIFTSLYGTITDYVFLALLPGYYENKNSSLLYMINYFIEESQSIQSEFILNDVHSFEEKIRKARKENKKIILWGVSFALLDWAELYPMDLSDVIVFETGGMKGRRREMIKEELHTILKTRFNIKTVHSEYGMTELLSQAYSHGNGLFQSPPWMKILVREIHDPFAINAVEGNGGINIIDLANVDSCAFIETQDLGNLSGDGNFEILGRFDDSDIRGCNLLYLS